MAIEYFNDVFTYLSAIVLTQIGQSHPQRPRGTGKTFTRQTYRLTFLGQFEKKFQRGPLRQLLSNRVAIMFFHQVTNVQKRIISCQKRTVRSGDLQSIEKGLPAVFCPGFYIYRFEIETIQCRDSKIW